MRIIFYSVLFAIFLFVSSTRVSFSYSVDWNSSNTNFYADSIEIQHGDHSYYLQNGVAVNTVSSNPDAITLEVSSPDYQDNLMLYIYLRRFGDRWKVTQVKTFDAQNFPNWHYYTGFGDSTDCGDQISQDDVYLMSSNNHGRLKMKHVKLAAFMDRADYNPCPTNNCPPPTRYPTPTYRPTPTRRPTPTYRPTPTPRPNYCDPINSDTFRNCPNYCNTPNCPISYQGDIQNLQRQINDLRNDHNRLQDFVNRIVELIRQKLGISI